MGLKNTSKQIFLQELYKRAQGDFQAEVSMYDIGDDLGLEKEEAGALAQGLFIENLAEMKTLSGGMGITQKGFEALDIKIPSQNNENSFKLESGPVLSEHDRGSVNKLLDKIRKALGNEPLSHDLMEEIVIDLKTIDVQMLSPNPKTSIVRETFKSVYLSLKNTDLQELKTDLNTITS